MLINYNYERLIMAMQYYMKFRNMTCDNNDEKIKAFIKWKVLNINEVIKVSNKFYK